VDENGIRVTPGANCTDDSYRVYIFGGSTMWGYGVPDNNTIPHYLQSGLPQNVCVVNQADVGYNSTQSLIRLLELLQRGDVPDMVIFYDGSNDVVNAQRSSIVGAHFYYAQIDAVVNGTLVEPDAQPMMPLLDVLRGTATYRLLFSPAQEAETWAQAPFAEGFVEGIVQTYLTNVRAAYALSQEYDFAFYAFVQPVLPLVDRVYTDEEQRFIWDTPGGLVELFREVYPRIAAEAPDYVYYFANILDEQPNIIWIDFNHLTAWGNLAVATEILAVITPEVMSNE
jgi:lysophospholipase L1-like esterase